jgi:hypothetical protein
MLKWKVSDRKKYYEFMKAVLSNIKRYSEAKV